MECTRQMEPGESCRSVPRARHRLQQSAPSCSSGNSHRKTADPCQASRRPSAPALPAPPNQSPAEIAAPALQREPETPATPLSRDASETAGTHFLSSARLSAEFPRYRSCTCQRPIAQTVPCVDPTRVPATRRLSPRRDSAELRQLSRLSPPSLP